MILVMITFLLLLLIRMPVGFAIGISGTVFFLQNAELPLTTIVQLPISQTQNVTLLAVPLFIFAGSLMNASGITSRLIKLAMLLTGHMRGGLAQVSVVLSTLMGGVSGSSNADAAMQARVLGPELEKQGYPKGYSGSVIGYSSLIASTIPPGVGLILYGTIGEVSIGRLFAAGIVAGFLMMIFLMVTVAITSKLRGFQPAREKRASFIEILVSLKETIWALLFPVMLLIGLRLGLFTASEIGAFACVYALFVGFFIYKELTIKTLVKTLKESIVTIGAIMYMITMSGVFGYGIPLERIPQKMTAFVSEITSQPGMVLILVILFLLLFGMVMEGSVLIILLTPILLPLVSGFGVDPVFFGVIMSIVVTMGILTPPVGIAMYTICGILKCKMQDYLKENVPFVITIFVLIAVLIAVPDLVLFLPKWLYG
ncbi:TRAP transporter large permease [Alkalihalobacillus oceani]|uniref:TRAP transporter large permease n=1 Tax=Halalkalibacter oceani TaxID=1653776 RepID=UPI00203EA424|nr:TRAP transporter large permease [Halalkalibacter oceani]MCM3760017.1 TRAP transporter large permease [Halalkalibacter oceani]